MKCLAIDPGPEQSGFVLWDGGKILMSQIESNTSMRDWITHCRQIETCEAIVIEMVASFGMAVGASVFETCVWIGRFQQIADDLGYRIIRRTNRIQVKMHFCHSSRAKDSNIRAALVDRFGDKGTKHAPGLTYGLKAHLWSAFALAVMFTDQEATAAKV